MEFFYCMFVVSYLKTGDHIIEYKAYILLTRN
jgi:hypothetical protein